MNNNEHDNLWNLLGKAREPEVSPFFTRNVLREVRQSRQQSVVLAWFMAQWRIASLSAVAAALTLTLFIQKPAQTTSSNTLIADSSDYDVINNLDELIASQDTLVWLDTDSY
jgi:hypothetical protein